MRNNFACYDHNLPRGGQSSLNSNRCETSSGFSAASEYHSAWDGCESSDGTRRPCVEAIVANSGSMGETAQTAQVLLGYCRGSVLSGLGSYCQQICHLLQVAGGDCHRD